MRCSDLGKRCRQLLSDRKSSQAICPRRMALQVWSGRFVPEMHEKPKTSCSTFLDSIRRTFQFAV